MRHSAIWRRVGSARASRSRSSCSRRMAESSGVGSLLTAPARRPASSAEAARRSRRCGRPAAGGRPAGALPAVVPPSPVDGLLHRDGGDDLPEVGAVVEALEPALRRAGGQPVQGAQGHVLAVLDRLVRALPQASPRHREHPVVVAPPDRLDGLGPAGLQAREPSRDRAGILRRHARPPARSQDITVVRAATPSTRESENRSPS